MSILARNASRLRAHSLVLRAFSASASTPSITTLGTSMPSFPRDTVAAAAAMARQTAAILHHHGDTSPDSTSEPSFYSEEVDCYASVALQPITLGRLLQICQPPLTRESLIENAQYLCRERPVRYAKRLKLFQRLPYIVGVNPHLNSIYQIYYKNFNDSKRFPIVESLSDQREFIQMLARQSESLRDIMPAVARGFYESKKYISTHDRCAFLNELIKMRIGLRLLTGQHLALYHQFQATAKGTYGEETDNGRFQGIVDNRLKLAHMVRLCAQGVQAMCDMAYGEAPAFTIDGQTDLTFRYIPSHLEYMLVELLKNAFRSTVQNSKGGEIPPVQITISKGSNRVAIRIRDFGGGIPHDIQSKVFDYSFTTVKHSSVDDTQDDATLRSLAAEQSPIAGLGFGLPMTKIYAEFFGGSLNVISLDGYGCDAFLELPSIKVDRSPTVIEI